MDGAADLVPPGSKANATSSSPSVTRLIQRIWAAVNGNGQQLEFDPAKVTYRGILEAFFAIHDPTTRDRQGNDHGPQYRSAIFWHDESQRDIAREVTASLTAEKAFADPIVTEVTKLDQFYPAESYHQDYYRRNSAQPYCAFVISPKLAKFRKSLGQRAAGRGKRSVARVRACRYEADGSGFSR